MRTTRELLIEAIDILQEERNVLFVSNEVDGVITDQDAIDVIDKYDRWLKDARAATSQS